MDFIIFDI